VEIEYEERAIRARQPKPRSRPQQRSPWSLLRCDRRFPNAKETVTLRIDRDVLDHFQGAGPGWQDRINEALRSFVGK